MATVILGGLVTSTLLNLLVLPTLALLEGLDHGNRSHGESRTETVRGPPDWSEFGNCFQSSAEGESIDKLFTVL
jgi:hypothetical protein